jgi:hypothetical protein
MQYRLEEDSKSNGDNGGLGMTVDAVNGMATTREGRGQS